ncbi:MAG TPA: hypothetical protein EYO76_14470 [Flavobacteriaceae bacterium]|nr:hypothetical protein [Flavobacteriaceae bacterium]
MKKLIIINSIVWATVIILSAILFKENENWDVFFILIIALSTVTNGLINRQYCKQKQCRIK